MKMKTELYVSILIPEEFYEELIRTRFQESLTRIASEIRNNINQGTTLLAGQYELDVIEMLKESFNYANAETKTRIIH